MPTLQTRLRDTLSQWMFKELAVDDIRDVAPHFRRLRVSAPWLRTTTVAAGDKLQIMILESGPRTYTPFSHDASAGTIELLAYVHGDTPGAAWVRDLRTGARFRAFGPRGSLALSSLNGPVVLFGDETSFAIAVALQQVRGANDALSFVFECSAPEEAERVLSDLGLSQHSVIARQPARAHLNAVESEIRAALAQHPNAHLVLTGHAQMIQAIRAAFKSQPAAYTDQKVKAYWADGKRGLD